MRNIFRMSSQRRLCGAPRFNLEAGLSLNMGTFVSAKQTALSRDGLYSRAIQSHARCNTLQVPSIIDFSSYWSIEAMVQLAETCPWYLYIQTLFGISYGGYFGFGFTI